MPQLDFFAARDDQNEVLDFILKETDLRIFETASAFGEELREFKSLNEVALAHDLGTNTHGNGNAISLQLWSPGSNEKLQIEKIKLDPTQCEGHTFRYYIRGYTLMQLYFGGVHHKCGKVLTKSHFGYNSQIRAQKWGSGEEVDWESLSKLSNRIQYHIRRRLARAKVPGRPVLRQALKLARRGYALKEFSKSPWQYEIDSEIRAS